MKKVFQTDTTNVTGNCLEACVATFFGLELEEVPTLRVPNDVEGIKQRKLYVNFIRSRHHRIIFVPVWGDGDHLKMFLSNNFYKGKVIAAVNSFAHEGKLHAVVGRLTPKKIKVIHDPNRANGDPPKKQYQFSELDIIFPRHVDL